MQGFVVTYLSYSLFKPFNYVQQPVIQPLFTLSLKPVAYSIKPFRNAACDGSEGIAVAA